MSSSIRIRLQNVYRQPLHDVVDVDVIEKSSERTVKKARAVPAGSEITADDLRQGEVYELRVFPLRHRPLAVFQRCGAGETVVDLPCPVIPERVESVDFPDYEKLDATLQEVLEGSQLEDSNRKGEELYGSLGDQQKAGLLNIFAKLKRTRFENGRTAASLVKSVYRIRSDRIFADVETSLRDQVRNEASLFEKVSGALHTPPQGFGEAGSFKTREMFGNLQLTFFSGPGSPPIFKVDADIDDAGGIGHVFQVLRNWITGQPTNPYDIHEILVYNQELDPGYRLVMTA